MREVKFRAWDTTRKEYLSGGEFLIAIQKGNRPKVSITYLDVLTHPDMYRNRFIVEQFIGRSDKNGLEIYEGDIVEATWYTYEEPIDEAFGEVVYNQGWCAWCIWDEENKTMSELNAQGAYVFQIEILGNVHENPELLN